MEDFYNFNTQFSQQRMPTPVEMNEIKQMLSSGINDQILQAVEKIKLFTSEKESLSEIIRADIAEFLCGAIKPSDSVVLSAINNCLELLGKHLEFYTHNHSGFAIESIIRSLNYLMKDPENFNQSLNLLALILQGYNTHGVEPDKSTTENLLLLLPELEKTPTLTINSMYHIGLVILNLIDLRVSKWSVKAESIILNCFCKWFSIVLGILESDHPIKEKLILLCSTLCHSVIRCLVSNESSDEELHSEIGEQLKDSILFNVSKFLVNFGVPYFDNTYINEPEINPSHLENFYQVILYFYSDNLAHRNQLAHRLSQAGFLLFTARIISFDEISDTQKLRKLSRLVLFHIILSLSEDVFDSPEVWPHGPISFRSEIQKGIEELPLDPSEWLDALNCSYYSSSCKLALLLWLYFYCMTAESLDLLENIYPATVTFLTSSTGIETSVLLVKTLWLIFAMSRLSVTEDISLSNDTDATDKIVFLLETQEDVALVYTHHPAILYWTFSSKIKSSIQTSVIDLWLRNKRSDCREVEELIKKSPDVKSAILEILKNGKGEALESAFSSVKSILLESDELASNIWSLLPQVLANFTTDAVSDSVTNVDYLIELSSMKCPKEVDVNRNVRIASLLSEALLKSDLISVVPSLTLAFNLLQLGSTTENYWAVFVFLRSEDFVKKIIGGLSFKNLDISLCCIQIITLLWKECGRVKKPEDYEKIVMSKETVLQVLETNSEQILSAALDFIEQILISNFQSTFSIIEDSGLKFVEVLFLEVQNICIKTSNELSAKCWHCLTLFLTFNVSKELHLELATHPVLYELIRFYLPQLKESKNMADFLLVWIDVCTEVFQNPRYERRIFGQFYAETMKMIAESVMQDFAPDRQNLLEKVLSSGVVPKPNQS